MKTQPSECSGVAQTMRILTPGKYIEYAAISGRVVCTHVMSWTSVDPDDFLFVSVSDDIVTFINIFSVQTGGFDMYSVFECFNSRVSRIVGRSRYYISAWAVSVARYDE